MDFELRGGFENEKFENVAVDTDEVTFGASLNWRTWRTLGLRLLVERYDRSTSDGIGEFEENRGLLTLAYYWGNQEAFSGR
jgi:hypothetical protein